MCYTPLCLSLSCMMCPSRCSMNVAFSLVTRGGAGGQNKQSLVPRSCRDGKQKAFWGLVFWVFFQWALHDHDKRRGIMLASMLLPCLCLVVGSVKVVWQTHKANLTKSHTRNVCVCVEVPMFHLTSMRLKVTLKVTMQSKGPNGLLV